MSVFAESQKEDKDFLLRVVKVSVAYMVVDNVMHKAG